MNLGDLFKQAKDVQEKAQQMQALLAAIRKAGESYHPKLVFTSSIAVYGAPFPDAIPDDFHLTPLTSYGAQKAMCELLLADHHRRGFLDGFPGFYIAWATAFGGLVRRARLYEAERRREPGEESPSPKARSNG